MQQAPLAEDTATASVADAVQAPLTFILPQETTPYFLSSASTGGDPEVHFRTEDRTVTINDLRSLRDGASVETEGFELRRYPTRVTDLYDDTQITEVYNPEIIDLLKDVTGADDVVIFDHTRRSDGDGGAANPDGQRGPAVRVHVDYTEKSGPVRAGDALGHDRVAAVLADGGRVSQINVWRPIKGPVRRTPLALADARSIHPDNLVVTEQIFPDRVGEIYQLSHGDGQKWYWASDMQPDEVILIKGWDSLDDGRARFTPHGAFPMPGQQPSDPPRESIETRTYLLFNA